MQNDVDLSKSVIMVGDFFAKKSLSLYGMTCQGSSYAMLTYLDGISYAINKKEKNQLGFVMTANKGQAAEYYGYFAERGSDKNVNNLYPYLPNLIMDEYLQKTSAMQKSSHDIKVKHNGVFKEKITIGQSAKPGIYTSEFYVFSDGKIRAMHINLFEVRLDGNGGVVKHIMLKNRALYVALSIGFILCMSCLTIFSMDFFKQVFNKD